MSVAERLRPVIRTGWTATYAVHSQLLAGSLAIITLAAYFLPELVSVPSLATDTIAQPLVVFTSWASVIVAVLIGVEPSWQLFATARSRVRRMNLARVLCAAALGSALGAWPSGDWTIALVATTSLLGWALLAGGLLGASFAWCLPTLYLFATLSIGGTGGTEPPPWAWILRPDPALAEILASMLLLALGSTAWYTSANSVKLS